MFDYKINPFFTRSPNRNHMRFGEDDPTAFHQFLPAYRQTALLPLDGLTKQLGLGRIFIKDESTRFGLKSFKALGASYGIYRLIQELWEAETGVAFKPLELFSGGFWERLGEISFCCATDGNHGLAVAWMAKLLKCKAKIFLPGYTVQARINAIRNQGAEVEIIEGDYQQAVELAAAYAQGKGRHLISDTSYKDDGKVTGWIMSGYNTLFAEAFDQLNINGAPKPDLVLIQAGVGSFACAAAAYMNHRFGGDAPKLIVVEPAESDCLLESIKSADGSPRHTTKSGHTIMAGLNCGFPSTIAWPVLKQAATLFMSIDDERVKDTMRRLARPVDKDHGIIAGEAGAAGMAGLIALTENRRNQDLQDLLGLDKNTTALIINTEGDTDPVYYQKIVWSKNAGPS